MCIISGFEPKLRNETAGTLGSSKSRNRPGIREPNQILEFLVSRSREAGN